MQVILLERVAKLGTIGDIVTVKNGFGRNFLIPQGKALLANDRNKALFEARKADIEARNEQLKTEAAQLLNKLQGTSVSLIRQASPDGQMYGSVSARDIAAEVAKTHAEITHHHVALDFPIKNIGTYTVNVVLHPDVVYPLQVVVARSEAEAAEAVAVEEVAAPVEAEATTTTEESEAA